MNVNAPPLVSAILCNYNYATYVGEAIESVLNQTLRDFELIVVDDGSTDNSRDVIQRFCDPRIVTIFQENGGQASAFNAAFRQARGEYVAFLDSDDLWLPEKLRHVREIFDREDVAAVQHALDLVDSVSRPLRKRHPGVSLRSGVVNYLAETAATHCYPSGAPTSGTAYKSELLRRVFPLSLRWRYCADMPLRLAFLLGPVWRDAKVLGYYRDHGENGWWNSESIDAKRHAMFREAHRELRAWLRRHGSRLRVSYVCSPHCCAAVRYRYGAFAGQVLSRAQPMMRRAFRVFNAIDVEDERCRITNADST